MNKFDKKKYIILLKTKNNKNYNIIRIKSDQINLYYYQITSANSRCGSNSTGGFRFNYLALSYLSCWYIIPFSSCNAKWWSKSWIHVKYVKLSNYLILLWWFWMNFLHRSAWRWESSSFLIVIHNVLIK